MLKKAAFVAFEDDGDNKRIVVVNDDGDGVAIW